MWKVNPHAKQALFKKVIQTLIPEEASSFPCYFYPQPDYALIHKEVIQFKFCQGKPSLLLSSSPSSYEHLSFSLANIKSALNHIEDAEYINAAQPRKLIEPVLMEQSKMHYLLVPIIIILCIIYGMMQDDTDSLVRYSISCIITLTIVYVLFFTCHLI
jgi:hypothetical protein